MATQYNDAECADCGCFIEDAIVKINTSNGEMAFVKEDVEILCKSCAVISEKNNPNVV